MCHTPSTSSPSGFPTLPRKFLSLSVAASLLTGVPALRAAPGDIDPFFNIFIQGLPGNECRVIPAGDQFYIYGRCSSWSDIPSHYLTRWNWDGTRDTTFKASPIDGEDPTFGEPTSTHPSAPRPWYGGIRNTVRNVHIREDGTLLVTGYFGWRDDNSGRNGSGTFSFPMDHSGGGLPSVPASMENRGDAYQCLPLKDGGALLVGEFGEKSFINGFPSGGMVKRLRPDFSMDPGFVFRGSAVPVKQVKVFSELPDGGFLFWGSFYKASGGGLMEDIYYPYVRRLHSDGLLDTSFPSAADYLCDRVFTHPDGRLLISGYFVPNSVSIPLVRLCVDGTPDPDFKPFANLDLQQLLLQADGKFLSQGSIGGKWMNLFRMNPDGSLDSTFPLIEYPGIAVALMADGQVLLQKRYDGPQPSTFVRVKNDPAISVLEQVGSTTLRWRRGGSAPEVWRVTFEHRAAGAAGWTPLGEGTRVSGGWELASPGGLPVKGQIRARGWHPGHPNNSGWVEAMLSLGSPLNEWRLTHFGSPDNAGSGADGADPDRDGLPNLTEYVFGSDPETPSASPLPAWTVSDGSLECRFNLAPGLSPIGITAEWATHPASSSWQTVEGQADGTARSFKIPVSGRQRIFARFRLSAPQ